MESTVWHKEQKTEQITEYYVVIQDGEKTVSLILTHNAQDHSITSNIYTPPDINYTIHDGCDHENDECCLDDPESEESQDVCMSESHARALRNLENLEKQVKQRNMAEQLLARRQEGATSNG